MLAVALHAARDDQVLVTSSEEVVGAGEGRDAEFERVGKTEGAGDCSKFPEGQEVSIDSPRKTWKGQAVKQGAGDNVPTLNISGPLVGCLEIWWTTWR